LNKCKINGKLETYDKEENKAVEYLIARILEYINEKQVEETNE
jgi:hypothetical protein